MSNDDFPNSLNTNHADGIIVPRAEIDTRREVWLRHGCDVIALYGDDGEMQCGACCRDFKRMPMEELTRDFSELIATLP